MKKFKLIKEYPGSPKLGTIVENFEINPEYYRVFGDVVNLFTKNIENHPEFWEEVIEKDYEILSLNDKRNQFPIFNLINGCSPVTGETYPTINSKDWNIHSVKRLSDGEIFTIGDKVIGDYTNNKYNINSFVINKKFDKIIINGEDIHLNECEKEKLLFTTEDGVDIFEGDVFTTLNKNLLEPPFTYTANLEHKKYDKYLDFSTKEKAEEYLFINKSCLSYKEASDVMLHRDISAHYKKIIREKLKELVKQKLNK